MVCVQYGGVWMSVGSPRGTRACHFDVMFSPQNTHSNTPSLLTVLSQTAVPRPTNHTPSIPIIIHNSLCGRACKNGLSWGLCGRVGVENDTFRVFSENTKQNSRRQ
jgi:hypothetical protein